MRVKILLGALIAVLAAVAGPAAAQDTLPLRLTVTCRKQSPAVQIEGSALPGTVVQVRGNTEVVDHAGTFKFRSAFPIHLVAVRHSQIRRVRFDLPERAERWLANLQIVADLTRMRALVSGNLTVANHPPATAIVKNVQADSTSRTTVDHGAFRVEFPLVAKTNTLEWALQVGPIRFPGPALSFDVE